GQFGDVGAVADLAVGGDRAGPGFLGDLDDGVADGLGDVEADAVVPGVAVVGGRLLDPLQQIFGGSRTVTTEDDFLPVAGRELGDGLGEHGDVVVCGVGAGVSRAQQDRQDLTGVGAGHQDRVEPEDVLLVRRCRAFLLRVGLHERGVDVQNEPAVPDLSGHAYPGEAFRPGGEQAPYPAPVRSPRPGEFLQHDAVEFLVEQPPGGYARGDLPGHCAGGGSCTHRGADRGGAHRQSDRDIDQDLPPVVSGMESGYLQCRGNLTPYAGGLG